jgi:hypothetical protein
MEKIVSGTAPPTATSTLAAIAIGFAAIYTLFHGKAQGFMMLLFIIIIVVLFVTNTTSLSTNYGEGFQNSNESVSVDNAEQATLVNLQMMTCRLPPPFTTEQQRDPETSLKNYITDALTKGCRTFFLDIDYRKSKSTGTTTYTPMLVYKKGGIAVSDNSCDIDTAFKTLVNTGFSNGIKNPSNPIVVILNIIRSPVENRLQDTPTYLAYLDQIAAKIRPYEGNTLGISTVGNFRYYANEEALISLSITAPDLQNKLIIVSNGSLHFYGTTKGPEHLNHYVNLRYFMNDPNGVEMNDTATASVSDPVFAVVANANSLSTVSGSEVETWSVGHIHKFVIALPATNSPLMDQNMLPVLQLGVNSIPSYFNGEKPTTGYWGIGTPWVLRPEVLRAE